ncbi:hypothetical protein [Scopulibacillus cellulosilyticus]|uniref:Uncharacterized protein n=1 Tax=Scopulibacillus cellulosilyticus TaxID=2665665 RepID=A0ABW2PZZ6_9BACL
MNEKICFVPPIQFPDKQLDEPAFIAEWLRCAVKRYDNYEAWAPMKFEEIKKLRQCAEAKLERDKRKYQSLGYTVKDYKDIPYVPYKIIGIPVQESDIQTFFSPFFEIPTGLIDDSQEFYFELTPYDLLEIIKSIELKFKLMPVKIDTLFVDLFLEGYFRLRSSYGNYIWYTKGQQFGELLLNKFL